MLVKGREPRDKPPSAVLSLSLVGSRFKSLPGDCFARMCGGVAYVSACAYLLLGVRLLGAARSGAAAYFPL